jgi:hypothetical protein
MSFEATALRRKLLNLVHTPEPGSTMRNERTTVSV